MNPEKCAEGAKNVLATNLFILHTTFTPRKKFVAGSTLLGGS